MVIYIYIKYLVPVPQKENESFREQISATNKELETTKEKLNTLEQAWSSSHATGKLAAAAANPNPAANPAAAASLFTDNRTKASQLLISSSIEPSHASWIWSRRWLQGRKFKLLHCGC